MRILALTCVCLWPMAAFGADTSPASVPASSAPVSSPLATEVIFDGATRDFLAGLDADAVSLIPVRFHGRWSIMDTVAREQLQQMYGRQTIEGLPPALAYLEIYCNTGQYLDKPLIYVKDSHLRQALAQALPPDWRERFRAAGWRLPPACFMGSEEWQDLLDAGRASYADFNRITRSDWETVLPPVCPDLLPAVAKLAKEPGLAASVDRLSEAFSSFMAVGAIEMPSIAVPPGHMVDISTTAPVKPDWDSPWRIHGAWRQRDWAALGTYLKEAQVFGEHLRQTGSPNIDRLELFYNRAYKATIAWAGFALATLVLLAAAIAGKRWLRRLGLAVLWLATLALACGFAARWIISGRAWYLPPIMNTFEAVTASALLAAVAALVMEARWPRNFLAIAAGFYGAGALLACSLWSSQIGADITPAHGILYSPLLAVHVAIIIIGHAMAGMTLVISLIYLVVAVAGWLRPVETVPAELLAFRTGAAGPAQPHAPGLIASHKENAHAGALIVIDKCNLIVAQMAAWAIALGTALGAYWGDRAWGHWWSWDIKETWALVNVLIFIVVLHVRYVVPPRWRGVATAILCIVGCAVMLFNWIAVNYLFHGMHSYA